MKEKICIVAESYPTNDDPSFPFVQQLASSLTNIGYECFVIAPQSITRILLRRVKRKKTYDLDVEHENQIKVFRPYIVTFSNTNNFCLLKVADFFWEKAINKCLKKIGQLEAIYCYFWHVGLKTIKSIKVDYPVFVQASECDINIPTYLINEKLIKKVAGVVCASSKNQEESIRYGLTTEEDSCIIVNGYRKDEFYPIPQEKARAEYGFSQDKFIIAFVGGFIKRKGITQLCKALDRFDDVYSIFIGKGDLFPKSKNILYADVVQHNKIVSLLNCADIFVLPTEAEGCCNAIIEALACGLPVVSSNKKFNDEILDETCSIRINEQNVDEIYNAIKQLKENRPLLTSLSEGAIEKSSSLTIEKRANKIQEYISRRLGK